MLKYIKVKNFLSFKDETEINFESSNYWNLKNNVFSIESYWKKTTLEKSMIIYWANASWKTNILKAIVVITNFVMKRTFYISPFLFDENTKDWSSFFEISFFIDNKEYIYNFELLKKIVKSENLYEIKWKNKKITLFSRKNQNIKFENWFSNHSNLLEDKVRENVSVLWILDQFNWKLNNKPILYFFSKLVSLWRDFDGIETVNLLKLNDNDEYKNLAIEFLKCADINIYDIRIEEQKLQVINLGPNEGGINFIPPEPIIRFWHKINWTDELEYLPFLQESDWTKKLFWILWRILVNIKEEWVLCFDEIEMNLHPHIVKNLFNLIHSDLWKKYQFIFTTHNLELMNLKEFKKEQIGIIEKSESGSTKFYTLYDFEDLRSENDIKKLYNLWSLWWVPILRDFSSLIKQMISWENKKGKD